MVRTDEGGLAMHATIHRFRRWPDEESPAWARLLLTTLLDGAETAGSCVLGRLDGMDGAVVVLWDDAAHAAAAAARTAAGARWLDAIVYRVVAVEPGVAAGEQPRFAQLIRFDGAGGADRADAIIRAGRERIAPAVRDVRGVVGTYVLRAEDSGIVVLTLLTGVDTPEALRRAVLATELLPWEDPAQLADPERIDIDRVLVAGLPAHTASEVLS
jgi:hypothetical protein